MVYGLSGSGMGRRIEQAAYAAGLDEGFSGLSPRVGMVRDLVLTQDARAVHAQRDGRSESGGALLCLSRCVRASSKGAAQEHDGDALRDACVD